MSADSETSDVPVPSDPQQTGVRQRPRSIEAVRSGHDDALAELEVLRRRVRELEADHGVQCTCVEHVGDDAPTLCLQLDRAGRVVRFNPAFEELSGYALRDVRGQDWFEIFVPAEARARARRRFAADRVGELAQGQIVPLRTRDRGERAVRWYATALGDPSAYEGLFALGGDVTELVEAQDELRASDERFRRIASYVDDVLWVIDLRDPRASYVSPAVETTYGLSAECLREEPFSLLQLVHDEDRPALRALVSATQSGGWGGQTEFRVTLGDGTLRWIRSRFKVVADARGERTHIVGTVVDVTRSKESERLALDALGSLEQRFAARTAELEAAQDQLHEIVERLPGITLVCTPNGTIVEASRRARALAATHVRQLVAQDEALPAMLDAIASAAEGESVKHRLTIDLAGRPMRVDLALEPLRDRSGSVALLLVAIAEPSASVVSSVPPRPAAEAPPIRALQERVKNDLQIISSLLFLEARRIADPKLASGFRASVDRVRVLAMAHEHCDPVATSRVNLASYLHAISVGLTVSHGDHGGRIRVTDALSACEAALDVAVPCGLVTSELVSNALAHAFPDDRCGTISVTLRSVGPDEHELAVQDDGIGSGARRDGLGLHLCDRLAAQIGSKLEIAPGPDGVGTRSSIRFKS